MPRSSSLPTCFEELRTLSISFFRKNGYLIAGRRKSGTVTWSRNGTQTAAINIQVDMGPFAQTITLKYRIGERSYNEEINFVSVPSNLGIGVVWFFECPKTGKRCRKLYSSYGRFVHREASTGEFYEKQIESKYGRGLMSSYGAIFAAEKANEEIHSRYFKRYYRGKPTRRYLRLNKILVKAYQVKLPAPKILPYW
jgi:hypothetical protein